MKEPSRLLLHGILAGGWQPRVIRNCPEPLRLLVPRARGSTSCCQHLGARTGANGERGEQNTQQQDPVRPHAAHDPW